MERISTEKQKKFYFPIIFKRKKLENREDYKITSLLKLFMGQKAQDLLLSSTRVDPKKLFDHKF